MIATRRPKRSAAVRVEPWSVTLGRRRWMEETSSERRQEEEDGSRQKKNENDDEAEWQKTTKEKTAPPKKRRKKTSSLVCDERILHLENFLNARDLRDLDLFLSGDDVQESLGEAVLHDSNVAQYASRKCSSAWVPLAELPSSRKLKLAVRAAQDAFETLPRTLGGALRCHYEDVQYCEYAPGGHFKEWHVDADDNGHDEEDGRELTIVVLLAEPGVDFHGGDFQAMPFYPQGPATAVQWRKGDVIAFPAKHLWHRVLPTTAGLRKSLVLWAKHPQ